MTKEKNKKISYDEREYVEKILKEFPKRDNVIRKLELDIEEIKLEDGMSAVCYDGDNVQTSNISDTVTRLAIMKEEKIAEIVKTINRKKIHYSKIEVALENFTDMQSKLIEYRFFKGYTWGMCAKHIGYSDRNCINIVNQMIADLNGYYGIRKPVKKNMEG